ncbi:protein FAM78A isoform X2 [Denticeps clupeoides]|uniref:protein FAM78A isoform X2 n=1 Tax=Denticeps clupeoides TaxID=299321 RepID=UPI0010A2E6DB|nr:protein FAM78A-like isoform X2 [Denticeps clupeoides]
MGCIQSVRRKPRFSERIAVVEVNTSIDPNPTAIDESSDVVLRYRTPYFRAAAQVLVPPVACEETWTVGWIQACNKMDFYNTYGSEGISSWELPELKTGQIQAISDSDGVTYPCVTWTVPVGTADTPPRLSGIQRDQHFTTWLVALNETTAEMVLLQTIRWRMQLSIEVDPKRPLGQRGRLLEPQIQDRPQILETNEPIPPNALVRPNANDAQVLMWRPGTGKPIMVIRPKYSSIPL